MKTVLTIAGSGLQRWGRHSADIKTIAAQHMYAMSVITALTAQNTTGVSGVQEISPDFVAKQLDCILPTSPGQRQNWHAVREGTILSCGGKAPAVWGQKRGGRSCDGVHQRNQPPFGGRAQGPFGRSCCL